MIKPVEGGFIWKYTRFFYKQHFYKPHLTEIGKKQANVKQPHEAEVLLFENNLHSTSTLPRRHGT